jgi:phage FluMu protein Com
VVTSTLTEMLCRTCGKRLLDYVNAVKDGMVIIRKRCRYCKTMNEVTVGKS